MVLIASGAYVEPELEVEFGRIPPSFLPLGNRRLFVHQCEAIRSVADRILLSLPEDFEVDATDRDLLDSLNVETVLVPTGLSLGNSIVTVMNLTAATSGSSFSILHGDTLLWGLDLTQLDAVSVGNSADPGYVWGFAIQKDGRIVSMSEKPDPDAAPAAVLSGWFAFSNPTRLVQCIARHAGNFLLGLADYAAMQPLQSLTAQEWFDFGHAGTFHRSKRRVSTARQFNHLVSERRSILKSSTKPQKIEAEANWFESLPAEMRLFTPAYLGRRRDDTVSYAVEYLNHPTLSDLFVFGRLSRQAWDRIFLACDEFLSACASYPAPDPEQTAESVRALYLDKTLARLEEFARAQSLSLSEPCRLNGAWLPSLERIAIMVAQSIPEATGKHLTLVHGDFCFSNILYDYRADTVRVIDPRGLDASGNISIYGDIRYDVGKLHHSAVGKYDYIIAKYFDLKRSNPLEFSFTLPRNNILQGVEDSFHGMTFAGQSPRSVTPAISVLLFLSMLPLHSDDPKRQMALLANSMRLFLELDHCSLLA
ncbi:MAG TPA: phosphotransferase [Clostridia bacterium]|nr:phosphotransferase [Clostridia bacterium]